jgi:hypothetical protein
MRTIGFAVLLVSQVLVAQAAQPPATPQEVEYLRFILLNVASLDHDPKAISSYEDSLVKLHGFSKQDSAALHAAGQTLHALLLQQRQANQALVGTNKSLPASAIAALQKSDKDRERTIVDVANNVLNSVSPEVASRLRAAAHNLSKIQPMP